MKRFFLLFALSLLYVSCDKNEFTIEGTVHGLEGDRKAVLQKQDDKLGSTPVDTADISNGKFTFSGKVDEPSVYAITIDGIRGRSFIIVENEKMSIDIYKDSIFANKIGGTKNNEELTAFNAQNFKIQKKLSKFETENRSRLMQAMTTKDTAALAKLKMEYVEAREAVEKELQGAADRYISEHPDSYLSVILVGEFFVRFRDEPEKIEQAFAKLSPEMKKTRAGLKIQEKLKTVKVINVGSKAPDFSAMTPDGKKVSLAESMGRVTIIDFWASWCPPCRKENPNVVALYKEFQPKGLKIVGVSLDKPGDKARWTEAIAKDGLEWTQVSNLQHWDDPIAKRYGIEEIPAVFVLNQYGVVVAKNLHGKALRDKVAQMLK